MAGLQEAVKTRNEYRADREALKQKCIDTGNYGAAVKTQEMIGKVMGHYQDTERTETINVDALNRKAENVMEMIRA